MKPASMVRQSIRGSNLSSSLTRALSGDSSSVEPSFVPLVGAQGQRVADFLRDCGGRELIIWGAGVVGRSLAHLIDRSPCTTPRPTLYFADRQATRLAAGVAGIEVIGPEDAIHRASAEQARIVLAVGEGEAALAAALKAHGLSVERHYVSYRRLARPEAAIEVAGDGSGDGHRMSFDAYRRILAKLLLEMPEVFHLDLSGWGEPLDHPQLPEMIEWTVPRVPCTVRTRLAAGEAAIERVVRAAPTQLVVLVDASAEAIPAGEEDIGWAALGAKLKYLARIRRDSGSPTEIRVQYPVRRGGRGPSAEAVGALCERLDLRMVRAVAYPASYDALLDARLAAGENGARAAEAALAGAFGWDIERASALAMADRGRPCLCQRIFPVIRADRSVVVCHLFEKAVVCDDYEAIDGPRLDALRGETAHCRACQSCGLHRLDIGVLEARHRVRLRDVGEDGSADRVSS